jgi:hypothetical protein
MLPSLFERKIFPLRMVPVVIPFKSLRKTLPSRTVPKVTSPLSVERKTFPPRIVPEVVCPLESWKNTFPLLTVPNAVFPFESSIVTEVLCATKTPDMSEAANVSNVAI